MALPALGQEREAQVRAAGLVFGGKCEPVLPTAELPWFRGAFSFGQGKAASPTLRVGEHVFEVSIKKGGVHWV